MPVVLRVLLEVQVPIRVEEREDVRPGADDLVGIELRVRRFEFLDRFRGLHHFVGLGQQVEEERRRFLELDGQRVRVRQGRRIDNLVVGEAVKVRVLGHAIEEHAGLVAVDVVLHVGGRRLAAIHGSAVLPEVVRLQVQDERRRIGLFPLLRKRTAQLAVCEAVPLDNALVRHPDDARERREPAATGVKCVVGGVRRTTTGDSAGLRCSGSAGTGSGAALRSGAAARTRGRGWRALRAVVIAAANEAEAGNADACERRSPNEATTRDTAVL